MDDAPPGQYFDDQLAAMVTARENGLIDGIGLSNITPVHLRRALAITDIACVQNLLNLADRRSMPVLEECHAHGIAFVPFFPLGSRQPIRLLPFVQPLRRQVGDGGRRHRCQ